MAYNDSTYLKKGNSHYRKGRFYEAIDYYNLAIHHDKSPGILLRDIITHIHSSIPVPNCYIFGTVFWYTFDTLCITCEKVYKSKLTR